MEQAIIRNSPFGVAGLAVAMVAFALAVLPPWLSQLNQPPPRPVEDVIADTAVKIKDRMIARLEITKSETAAAPNRTSIAWKRYMNVGSMVLAVGAIFLAVFSFIRRENWRLSGSAVALGGAALAWQYLMMALAVIFIAIIIGAVLNFFGGG
jgi:hypothetical protein